MFIAETSKTKQERNLLRYFPYSGTSTPAADTLEATSKIRLGSYFFVFFSVNLELNLLTVVRSAQASPGFRLIVSSLGRTNNNQPSCFLRSVDIYGGFKTLTIEYVSSISVTSCQVALMLIVRSQTGRSTASHS